jgi:hypothetical protein
MGVAYRIGGTAGLAIFKGTLVAVIFIVVLQLYRRASPKATAAVIVLLTCGIGRQAVTLRPQLWTLLGVALLCRLFIGGTRRWWLVAMPALFLVWVNLHGGWIVGAALLATWTAFQMVRPEAPRRFIVGVAMLSAAATLVNPYGWEMWAFIGGTVRMSRAIVEWQPLVTVPVIAWTPWIAVVAGVTLLLAREPRPRIDRVAMVALLAFGAFRVERLSALCVVAAVVLMSPTIVARWGGGLRAFDPLTRAEAGGLCVAMVLLTAASGAFVLKTARCIPLEGTWIPDSVAGRALAATTTRGRIVTYFDWGQYAIWHFAPRLRVSMDGRRETVYSDAVLQRQAEMEAATPEGLAYLQELNPNYIWLPSRLTKLRDWLATHGYRLDLATDRSFVAVRADQPALPAVGGATAGCFPGP